MLSISADALLNSIQIPNKEINAKRHTTAMANTVSLIKCFYFSLVKQSLSYRAMMTDNSVIDLIL